MSPAVKNRLIQLVEGGVSVSGNQDLAPGNEGRGMRTFRHILKWIGIILALALVLGMTVQLLWNWLMPEIFGLGRITVLQSIGLLVLTRLLFGRMGQRRDHAGYLTGKYGFRSLFGGGYAEEGTAPSTIRDQSVDQTKRR
jgi:hypothetical protein